MATFFYVEPDAIADKSKANILAKGLVCVQVLWVAGQTIERKVAGLPISLLEYHTLVHVVCALVMYVLWFQKPYDIQYPTLIATDAFPEALAFIVASSRWKGYSGFTSSRPRKWLQRLNPFGSQDEDPHFDWYGSQACPTNSPLELENNNSLMLSTQHRTSEDYWYQARPEEWSLRFGTTEVEYSPILETTPSFSLSIGQALRSGLGTPLYRRYRRICLSHKDKLRLDLAGNFITTTIRSLEDTQPLPTTTFNNPRANQDQKQWRKTPLSHVFSPGIIRPYGWNLIAPRAQNTAGYNDLTDRLGDGAAINVLFMALVLVLSTYGAIHLAAGHTTFSTAAELILWKSSCYILLSSARIAALFFAFLQSIPSRIFPNWLPNATENVLVFEGDPVVTLLYVSAQIFIVVESFVSLRHMPAGVYQTPDRSITSYIPHI